MSGQAGQPDGRSTWLRYLQAGIVPRVVMILLGVPCLAVITWRGGVYFLLLVNLIQYFGLREFYGMVQARGYRPLTAIGTGCGLALSWYLYFGGAALSLLLTVMLMVIMAWQLVRGRIEGALDSMAVTFLGVLYVGWLGSHLVLLRELPADTGAGYGLGALLVLFVAAVIWAGDTAAYVVGVALGRRPLAPRISPKKTVAGAVGGLGGSALAGGLCAGLLLPGLSWSAGAVVGLAGGLIGQIGDLVESLLKRDLQIKDTAELIPGHGGMLDRFDSLLFAAPVLYYYFRFFVV